MEKKNMEEEKYHHLQEFNLIKIILKKCDSRNLWSIKNPLVLLCFLEKNYFSSSSKTKSNNQENTK